MPNSLHPASSRRSFLAQAAATLAFTRTSFALPRRDHPSPPQPAPFGSITAGGDLGHRTAQNFARLQEDLYRPPLIFRGTNWKAWPGDMEGRALLAVTLLSRATGQEPAYLASMYADYQPQLNPQGYFGPLLDLRAINEQQLSGHGWFLRGLCEYYAFKRQPQTLTQIQTIVRNLALPLRGHYATYPIDPATRTQAAKSGGVDGHLAGQQGDWIISTDTLCAFIFLDGLTDAWTILKSVADPAAPPLKALIDEAFARFLQIDLITVQAQTHATLTCLRAILRVYTQTAAVGNPDPTLLRAVEDRYRLYRTTAMTEHYANYNWFGRPETWTEPCAILDSFLIATQLWQLTANPAYLEDAHLIWTNGVGRGLRANGGFGTDLCAGFKTPFLKVRTYEAFFCCTMRGGEGHARAIQYLYQTRPASTSPAQITVPFFSDSTAHHDLGHGPIVLRQTAAYPYPGPVRIEILSTAARTPITFRLFAPRWTSNHRVTLNGRPLRITLDDGFLATTFTPKPGDILQLDHDLRIAARDTLNAKSIAGYYAFKAGPLLLVYNSPAPPASFDAVAPSAPTAAPPPARRASDPTEIHIPRNATLIPTAAPGEYRVANTNLTLTRINDLNDLPTSPKDPCTRQILFREA